MAEAAALRFARENTAVPVPEVHDAYMRQDRPDCGAILMKYIEGDALHDVWGNLEDTQNESIITQLMGYMEQLRAIKGDFIAPWMELIARTRSFPTIGVPTAHSKTKSNFVEDVSTRCMKAGVLFGLRP
jgi:tRNA A-37 threonylcarbamoyl transferase component Bud32